MKKINMWRKIFAVVGGALISIGLGIIVVSHSSRIITQFIPVLLGTLFAGYVARMKGWLCGMLVAILSITTVIVILTTIAFSVTKSISPPKFRTNDLIKLFLVIPCGALGGYIGEYLVKKHKRVTPEK